MKNKLNINTFFLLRTVLLIPFFLFTTASLSMAQNADLTLGQVQCSTGGGGFKVILDSTKETHLCVALDPGNGCEAILRELPSVNNFEQVAVRGEPKIVCITAKRAMVVCKGSKVEGSCGYQIVSIDHVTNPAYIITIIIILVLMLIVLFWRAFGPFFQRR